MSMPSLNEAMQLFEKACQITDEYNIQDGLPKRISRRHYLRVAENAKLIAEKTPYLNPEKAYILGLLHDYGEYKTHRDNTLFHGTVGYDEMMKLGYDEVAKICLTHSFFCKHIYPEDYTAYPQKDILRAAEYIRNHPLDDYDKLIQISDLMVKTDKNTNIEERLDFVADKYHVPTEVINRKKQDALALKSYFDNLCGQDIYKIVGLI